MKDKRFFICLVLLISSIMVSCSWQIPEKVSVKTNADYNFSAGNLSMPLDKYLDIKKIMEQGTLPNNVKIYDYFPGEKDPNTQRYLLKVALAEIPLDLDSMMAQINLEENLKAMEFSKDITVPTVKTSPLTKSLDLPNIESPVALTKEVKDLKFSLPDLLANTGIEQCVIAEGALNFSISGLNDDASYDVTLGSTGGLAMASQSASGNKTAPATISLANAALKPGTSEITVSINFKNVRSLKDPVITITPVFNKLGSVTVDLGADVKTEYNGNVALDKNVTDIVSSITLGESGFDIIYTNTLPEGNDVSLTANSAFLGLTENTVKFAGGSVNKTVAFKNKGNTKVDLKTSSTVDFNVKITLPGQTSSDNKITIKNIAMGDTYKLGVKLKPVLNWVDVSVKTSALNDFAKAGKVDLGLNLNKILTDLGTSLGNANLFTSIEIKDLPVYIFCGKPQGIDALKDLKFQAAQSDLYLVADDVVVNDETSLVGTPIGTLLSTKEPIGFVDSVPEFKDKDVVVTDDLKMLPKSATSDLGNVFTNMIQKPGKLVLDYSVKATGATGSDTITIKESELKGTTKVALEAYIDLGLALSVPSDISIDLAKMESFKDFVNRDILNGAGKSIKDQGTDKYLTAVKNVSVRCDIASLPFATEAPITFKMISNVGEWNLNLRQGQALDISLVNNQIESLFNNASNPNCEFKVTTMQATLPKGSFSIPRAKKVDGNLSLNLKTDGTVKVWEKGQNNGGNK